MMFNERNGSFREFLCDVAHGFLLSLAMVGDHRSMKRRTRVAVHFLLAVANTRLLSLVVIDIQSRPTMQSNECPSVAIIGTGLMGEIIAERAIANGWQRDRILLSHRRKDRVAAL